MYRHERFEYQQNQVILEDSNDSDGLNIYCVWCGPETSPIQEFVLTSSPEFAEFLVSMRRIKNGFTAYIMKTVILAKSSDKDKNPEDLFSEHELARPSYGRFFRAWLYNCTSLVIKADYPALALAVAAEWTILNNAGSSIHKITELPFYYEQDPGKDCGNKKLRQDVYGSIHKNSGQFKFCEFAEQFKV